MTREEIISGLKFTVEMFLLEPSTGETITEPRNDMDKTTIDACKGAIELLEQEPILDKAIPKADYEARLKADMVAMLEEIDLEFEELTMSTCEFDVSLGYRNIIEQKINALRGEET